MKTAYMVADELVLSMNGGGSPTWRADTGGSIHNPEVVFKSRNGTPVMFNLDVKNRILYANLSAVTASLNIALTMVHTCAETVIRMLACTGYCAPPPEPSVLRLHSQKGDNMLPITLVAVGTDVENGEIALKEIEEDYLEDDENNPLTA